MEKSQTENFNWEKFHSSSLVTAKQSERRSTIHGDEARMANTAVKYLRYLGYSHFLGTMADNVLLKYNSKTKMVSYIRDSYDNSLFDLQPIFLKSNNNFTVSFCKWISFSKMFRINFNELRFIVIRLHPGIMIVV